MFEAAVQLRRDLLMFEAAVQLRRHLLIFEATVLLRQHLLITEATFNNNICFCDYECPPPTQQENSDRFLGILQHCWDHVEEYHPLAYEWLT